MMKVRMNVAGNKQIEVAVAVVVGPGGAGTEATHLDARAFGHILELTPAQVVVQHVMSVAGHVQIRQAIVVIIANRDRHAPSAGSEPGSRRDVGEMEIGAASILVVQSDHRVAARQEAIDRGVIHNRDIEPAIAIQKRDTATSHRLHDVAAF
jgi:hypothetical protein